MSGYSDYYKDQQRALFLNQWTPDGVEGMKVTEENLRFYLARMRAAESELKEIKSALSTIRKASK